MKSLTTREVRHKLELMAFIIFLTRAISMIPVPGVNDLMFKQWMAANSNDALNLFSAFTGGAFENFSMFALGITPLITAQIIIQLLTSVVKPLSKLQKKGEHGQKVLKRITNIVAIIMAAVQSCCMSIGFGNSGLISGNKVISIIAITVTMTAGTGIMMWLAHVLTEKTIGNGVSILLMANIVSRMPSQFKDLFTGLVEGKTIALKISSVVAAVLVLVVIVIVVIYMSEGYHPLHVQYSQKMSQSGEEAETGQIPIKVSISGVMPVIFASSIMAIPQLIATITGKGYGSGFSKIFLNMMSITFNAAEVSDNIRKSGGFIPGIRAGENTEFYIQSISRRLTTIGVIMLICVTVIPITICGSLGLTTTLSGTSLIIVVGVVTETIQQIQLEMAGRNYCGILCRD